MATADIQVSITPINRPTEAIVLALGNQQVTIPAPDVAAALLERAFHRAPASPPVPRLQPPAIGNVWLSHGGYYAGITRGRDGGPDQHLIVHDVDKPLISWHDAKAWAAGLDGGFRLPTRAEQALLFANVPELFAKEWYWSGDEYAGDAEYAWYQSFTNGTKDNLRKNLKLRARAVRRVPIE